MAGYIKKSFADIFKEIDPCALKIENNLQVPDDFYQQLLDYVLERGYINEVKNRRRFLDFAGQPGETVRRITWLQVMRLPIHPNEMKEYDLLSRWQGVLSTLHTWGHRLIFLLQRKNGETRLYLGTASLSREISAAQAIEQFREAATGSMPGIDLEPLTDSEKLQKFTGNLLEYNSIGAVTGIPSFKKDSEFGMLQTLDQIAFGIRDSRGAESDFALMVIADPLDDTVVSETMSKFHRLGSEIHTNVKRTLNESETNSKGKQRQVGMGSAIGGLVGTAVGLAAKVIPVVGPFVSPMIHALSSIGGSVGGMADMSSSDSKSTGQSVSAEYLDKFAEYAEKITEIHCERLKRGRNLGFWNTGVYVLGKSQRDINTVMGILRSIYSGDSSYIEPIRTAILDERSGAIDIVRRGELIPLANEKAGLSDAMDEWNIFGKAYQYLSTPMNTEELSLATSLPRRDVPGLRFVKSSVRFASNSAQAKKEDTICLGHMVDIGVVQKNEYRIDTDALVRHAIVAGSTGSGKSTTCKAIISEVLNKDIPVMIIEPAKDDYVRWAIDYNRKLQNSSDLSPEGKERRSFQIFMPCLDSFDGVKLEKLELNPFQPASIPNVPVDLLSRVEKFIAIMNASLPNDEILPILFDQVFNEYIEYKLGPDFLNGDIMPPEKYPKLSDVGPVAAAIMQQKSYGEEVQRNLTEAIATRLKYIVRGKRGQILNVEQSLDFNRLFSKPTIINISRISDSRDKALIMSVLMLALHEYRVSCYTHDPEYRKKAQANKLLHLTVIEEAHNLLMKPAQDLGRTGNAQQVAADLFSNMLSEIRGYGQGLVIVDQIPTRLVPDVLKNTNYKIVHRLTAQDDCETMAGGLALREDQKKIIPALGIGHAIICGDNDDAAAWVKLNIGG